MKKERQWLEQCVEAYKYLFSCCEASSKKDDFSEFRNDLDKFVCTIFDIFKEKTIFSEFRYDKQVRYDKKELLLIIQYPRSQRHDVSAWFKEHKYKIKDNFESDFATYTVVLSVEDIIDTMIQTEIKKLREECEEIAAPYFDNEENKLLSEYEDMCLEEDPYYLGVRFISYSGEYPNYCSGNLILVIEGIQHQFYLPDLLKEPFSYDIRTIPIENFPPELHRYYYEIIRVMKKNLRFTCCGGCL